MIYIFTKTIMDGEWDTWNYRRVYISEDEQEIKKLYEKKKKLGDSDYIFSDVKSLATDENSVQFAKRLADKAREAGYFPANDGMSCPQSAYCWSIKIYNRGVK